MACSIAALLVYDVAKLSSSFSSASEAALSAASKSATKSATKSVKLVAFQVRAAASDSQDVRELSLLGFQGKRALKVRTGLQNFGAQRMAAVVTAAAEGGATHVDSACDAELVKLATRITGLPVSRAEKLDIIQTEGDTGASLYSSGLQGLFEKGIGTALSNLNDPMGMG